MPPCHLLFRLKKYICVRGSYVGIRSEGNYYKTSKITVNFINEILIMKHIDKYDDEEYKLTHHESVRYGLCLFTSNNKYRCVIYLNDESYVKYVPNAVLDGLDNMIEFGYTDLYCDNKNIITMSDNWRDIIGEHGCGFDAEVSLNNRKVLYYFRDDYSLFINKEKYLLRIDTSDYDTSIIEQIDKDIYDEFIVYSDDQYINDIWGGFKNIKIYCPYVEPHLDLINMININTLTYITRNWLLGLKNKCLNQMIKRQSEIFKQQKQIIQRQKYVIQRQNQTIKKLFNKT